MGVKYIQWDEKSRMVGRGTMQTEDISEVMSLQAQDANRLLKESGMDHVMYGMTIFEGKRVAAAHFYLWPMDSKQFDRIAARCRCALVYAVHRKRG